MAVSRHFLRCFGGIIGAAVGQLKGEATIRLLFIGDIVGSTGRDAVKKTLPYVIGKHRPHIVIANAENAAGGKGLTAKLARELFEMGVHGITMGNHTWDNKDIFTFIDDEPRLVRPANYPEGTPGQGYKVFKVNGKELAVINMLGRVFMNPVDCPFRASEQLVDQLRQQTRCIFLDFHAEATSEKIALGQYLDGKISALVGTHTHVQTHDERILPGGTAYLSDVGMVGPRNSVLGMESSAVIGRFLTGLPARFQAAEGEWDFHAVLIDINEDNGKAEKIQLLRLDEQAILFA